MRALPIAALIVLPCLAAPQAAVVGSLSSTRPVTIGDVSLSPTGASWPVVAGDEISTEAATLLTTVDRDVVTFDANSRAKLSRPAAKDTYILLRKGGLEFDAKSGHLMVCAAGRLYVPQAAAKGVIRLDAAGAVFERLDSGAFAENGARGCDENGATALQGGQPGAAGAVIPATTPQATRIGVGTVAAIAAGAGVAAGAAALAGAAGVVSYNPCAETGCNTNPPPVSTISP